MVTKNSNKNINKTPETTTNPTNSTKPTKPVNELTELLELQTMLKWLLNKDLLTELVELQELLNGSLLGKYEDLLSRRGNDCAYTAKSKELFLLLQEKQIANKIEQIYKTYIEKK